jgi:DNA invertase Pin-like site-specific DNA recombinase
MVKAVAYMRVSSSGQLEGDGPERQELKIREYAKVGGYSIRGLFLDDVSGTKDSVNRPEFSRMLEFCVESGVGVIIVERMDRWARDLLIGETLLIRCRERKLTVIDASTGNTLTDESDDPDVRLMRQMLLALAQYEKDKMMYRLNSAKKRIRARGGRCDGPVGLKDTENGRRAIELARGWYSQGASQRQIAEELDRLGIPTVNGGPWRSSTVQGMLTGVKAPKRKPFEKRRRVSLESAAG